MTTVDDSIEVERREHPLASEKRPSGWRKRATPVLTYVVVVAIQLAVIWPIAMRRVLDGDEGFYSLAAKAVVHGQQPYVDFWFQYPPLLPYVYGGWTRIAGETFDALRALSALLTVVLGTLLFRHVARRYSRRLGVAAVLLYVSSALIVIWFSTFKSYALSTLLLFVAYLCVADVDRDEEISFPRWLAAGIFLGLSVDVRLFFVVLVPVFIFYATTARRDARVRRVGAFLVGFVLGLLPCIYFFLRFPRRFVDETYRSQVSRSDVSLGDALVQKMRTAMLLLSEAQFLILIVAAVTLGVIVLVARRRPPLALAIALVLGAVSLIPTPTYEQYFATLIPFLVVATIECGNEIRATLPRRLDVRLKAVGGTAVVIGLLFYVIAGAYTWDHWLNSGDFLPDAHAVRAVSARVDALTGDGEVVVAFWPGYLYESHAKPLSGLESDFATSVVAKSGMSNARASAYHMIPIGRLESIIRSRTIRVVVGGPQGGFLFPRPWKTILAESGYEPIDQVGPVTIYGLPDVTRRAPVP